MCSKLVANALMETKGLRCCVWNANAMQCDGMRDDWVTTISYLLLMPRLDLSLDSCTNIISNLLAYLRRNLA